MLGDIKKLGEYYGSIQVLGDSVSPLNGQKWKYFNVDQWIESPNEIIISAGNFDSKKYLHIFCIYGKNWESTRICFSRPNYYQGQKIKVLSIHRWIRQKRHENENVEDWDLNGTNVEIAQCFSWLWVVVYLFQIIWACCSVANETQNN